MQGGVFELERHPGQRRGGCHTPVCGKQKEAAVLYLKSVSSQKDNPLHGIKRPQKVLHVSSEALVELCQEQNNRKPFSPTEWGESDEESMSEKHITCAVALHLGKRRIHSF